MCKSTRHGAWHSALHLLDGMKEYLNTFANLFYLLPVFFPVTQEACWTMLVGPLILMHPAQVGSSSALCRGLGGAVRGALALRVSSFFRRSIFHSHSSKH